MCSAAEQELKIFSPARAHSDSLILYGFFDSFDSFRYGIAGSAGRACLEQGSDFFVANKNKNER